MDAAVQSCSRYIAFNTDPSFVEIDTAVPNRCWLNGRGNRYGDNTPVPSTRELWSSAGVNQASTDFLFVLVQVPGSDGVISYSTSGFAAIADSRVDYGVVCEVTPTELADEAGVLVVSGAVQLPLADGGGIETFTLGRAREHDLAEHVTPG